MTIKNFNVTATLLDGKPIIENDKELLLKDLIINILCGFYEDEFRTLSGADKFKRALLALKIQDGKDNFDADELGLIKDIIGKRATVPIVYQAFNILDGD